MMGDTGQNPNLVMSRVLSPYRGTQGQNRDKTQVRGVLSRGFAPLLGNGRDKTRNRLCPEVLSP